VDACIITAVLGWKWVLTGTQPLDVTIYFFVLILHKYCMLLGLGEYLQKRRLTDMYTPKGVEVRLWAKNEGAK